MVCNSILFRTRYDKRSYFRPSCNATHHSRPLNFWTVSLLEFLQGFEVVFYDILCLFQGYGITIYGVSSLFQEVGYSW